MKRILSMILAFTLVLGFQATTAKAIDSETLGDIKERGSGIYVLETGEEGTYVEAIDLENGDAQISQYQDGILVSQYVVNRATNTIEAEYYEQDSVQFETIQLPEINAIPDMTPRGTSSGRLGRIRFEYYDGRNKGICGAYVDYIKNTGSIKYDITGTYRDIAGVVSLITAVLALPAVPALAAAKGALAYFSIAAGATSITLPSYELDSNYEQNEYKLTDTNDSSHKNNFYGTKYTITAPGKHYNDTYNEGTYYPTSSWGNSVFGTTIYQFMFAYSSWSIYAWN